MVFLLKGQQASPFVLRARRSLDRTGAPWHLRYLGQPEMGDKNRHALVRNCVDIATSENLTDFLMEMGFRMDHEFVARGHLFRKGIMKIVVYKVFRILVPGNTENTEALSLSYLVELSVVAPAGQDVVSDDMRNFAEQLKPLVHLEKIDPKRLMWLRQSVHHWGWFLAVTRKDVIIAPFHHCQQCILPSGWKTVRTQLVLCSGFLIWPVHFCDSLSNLNAKNNIENLDHPSAGGGETGIK